MKKGILLLFVLCGLLATTACGGSSGSVLGFPQDGNGQDSEERNENQVNEVYELNADLDVQMKLTESASSANTMTLMSGTQVSVLGTMTDVHGQEWVHLGLEYNSNDPELVSDVWVLADDLNSADITVTEDSDPYDENGYEHPSMSEAIRKKMTYCYRYVKLYLLDKGWVKEYLPGASAYMAATILPKYGFKKTGRSAANAKVDDVCVYKGGPSGHGHIEVLTSKGWYYGYGYKKSSIKNRTFIACFRK